MSPSQPGRSGRSVLTDQCFPVQTHKLISFGNTSCNQTQDCSFVPFTPISCLLSCTGVELGGKGGGRPLNKETGQQTHIRACIYHECPLTHLHYTSPPQTPKKHINMIFRHDVRINICEITTDQLLSCITG